MYTPPSPVVLRMVSTIGPWAHYPRVYSSGAITSATFESVNRAVYQAILVPSTCVVRRLWWVNGSTVNASYNVDVGIYADAGRKPGALVISTGSTAQGTASQVQFVDVTDTTIGPGLYWLAITDSSVISTLYRVAPNADYDALFRFEQASALPLPASATPVESSSTNLYLFGFATTASP